MKFLATCKGEHIKQSIKIKAIVLIVFFVLVLSVKACRNAGQWLVNKDEPVHADAIVILMGSIADRVLQTADLFSKGISYKVILVKSDMGAYKDLESRGVNITSDTEQYLNALVKLGIPGDSIIVLPGDAGSTQMEAMIIREYIFDKLNIDTLLLVSSSYHTRRASMIYKAALKETKTPVSVFCSPNYYTNFNAEKWWGRSDYIQVVLLEYLKIIDFLLFKRMDL